MSKIRLIFISFLFFIVQISVSAAQAPIVYFSPVLNQARGDTLTLILHAEHVQGLQSGQFNLIYEDSVASHVTQVRVGEIGEGLQPTYNNTNLGQTRIVLFGMSPIVEGNGSLLEIDLLMNPGIESGFLCPLTFEGFLLAFSGGLETNDFYNSLLIIDSDSTYSLLIRGDSNFDRSVTVTDVTLTVDTLIGLPPSLHQFYAGDMDDSGEITTDDVDRIAAIILDR
ncbi:MAG: hypothetical protein B6244_06540 [Candidatus Cloacimonetes bacterium 4572_55]|nr:MAG: hypothetical protein B6244_06540 [Candidatus Cloacimonetes bacterium 4572_55]